ncbi:polysaccharide pyruvyl transferase family protein [Paenibacillus mucilaginosus]|uniref:polysaccharide pyruvyl transferase family protein n=1 Tax=Paenibacillus mucilaginosus TaxID=61624 RepID=UPI001F27CA25|nr:polysaccharide pyruvyl transferase family protein [Paenibacillus mucilaginosus]MCG7212879.1 polysaccharide pyruvyl transferase family protein [Paenibacillus mucilaginosus]
MITPRLDRLLRDTREITLVGYYGVNNFGDDLMLRSILDKLAPYRLKVNLISYGGPIPWIGRDVRVYFWTRGRRGRNIRMFLQAIASSSLVLWGGGTCFTDEDGDGLFRPMMLALLSGKRIAYMAAGIGNLRRWSRRTKTAVLLNASTYVSFRDDRSYGKGLAWTLGAKGKIERVEDPAHELLRTYRSSLPSRKESGRALVVAWRNLYKYGTTTLGNQLEPVAELCLRLVRRHGITRVIVINADSVFDESTGQRLHALLSKLLLPENIELHYDPCSFYGDKLDILAGAEAVLTSRLHVGAAAYFLDKTCYMYNYSPKMAYFVEEFKSHALLLLEEEQGTLLLPPSVPSECGMDGLGTEPPHG